MEIIYISLTGVISLLVLLFGIRVYQQDNKSIINRSFATFAVITVLWLVNDFATYQQNLADIQTLLYKLIFAVIVFMIYSLAYFVNYFPKTYLKLNIYTKILLSVAVLSVAYLSLFTNTIVVNAWMEDYGSNFQQGKYFVIFIIYSTVISLFILFSLINKFIRAREEERQQVKYLLYGLLLFIFFNLTFNLFIPLLTKSFIYGRIGTYSAVFFVGFVAYAILKTKLFNLRIILTESAVVILNVVSVVQIFISETTMEGLLRALFAVIIFYGSYILLQSVRREIKFREELQKTTEQLAHANSHLKELDAMKTEFVSLASHELLTPVSAIEGYLSMLLDEHMAKVEDPKALKYLTNVYSSAKRLARLIADMLNISRIEEGRLLVEKKDVDLSDLVKQVIDEIKFKSEEKKQKIVFENPDGWKTYADPDKIKEVIINLLGNSIKYSKNPGTITVRIEKIPTDQAKAKWQKVEDDIRARPLDDQEAINSAVDPHYRDFVGDEQLMIQVKDQGIGIPQAELPRLFKKFHRVGNYSTQESQGTGLGLYISRALVELHHGRIWADSEGEGHGSTFTFTLPDIEDKKALLELEDQAPKTKEALKPLAHPTKAAEDI